jgi:endonuclease/exonuclease/phosphatase family metal-dependent hydrolase
MSPPARLRIVTLNTWKNDGDYPARLAAMAAGLRALAPDIILLQEVFRPPDGSADTGRDLSAALGLALAYAPARAKPRLWDGALAPSESGLAILVRGEVLASRSLPLPSCPRGGDRITILARLRVAQTDILAASIHLSHLRHDDEGRRAQLHAIVSDPFWREPAALRLLGGDCNAPWTSPVFAGLRASLFPLHPAPETAPPTHPLPPREKTGRAIDWLFSLGAPATPAARGLALDAPDPAGIWPSDHAAVWADLDLPAPLPA